MKKISIIVVVIVGILFLFSSCNCNCQDTEMWMERYLKVTKEATSLAQQLKVEREIRLKAMTYLLECHGQIPEDQWDRLALLLAAEE